MQVHKERRENHTKKILSIIVLLFVCIFCMGMTVPDQTQQIEADQRLIIRTYELEPGTDPANLIDDPFVLAGCSYEYSAISKKEIPFKSTKTVSKEFELETQEKELADNLAKLEPTLEYEENGFKGILILEPASVKTEAAGYTTNSYTVSDTKTYSGLSYNDNSLIPQTTVKGGMTLKLSNVSWQDSGGTEGTLIPTTYTATAQYSGTGSSTKATGYLTKASYSGEISKTGIEKVIYTITYTGSPMEEPESEELPWLWISGGIFAFFMILAIASRRYSFRHHPERGKELPQ